MQVAGMLAISATHFSTMAMLADPHMPPMWPGIPIGCSRALAQRLRDRQYRCVSTHMHRAL